jgi:hypothetical protein
MSIIIEGRDKFGSSLVHLGIVSVHQVYNGEIELISENTATAIWPMPDRLYFAKDAPYATLTGYGHYRETYEKVDGVWLLKTTKVTRLRVEGC